MYVEWDGDTVSMMLDEEEVTIYFFITNIGSSELPYMEPFPEISTESNIAESVSAIRYYCAGPGCLHR